MKEKRFNFSGAVALETNREIPEDFLGQLSERGIRLELRPE